jgi:tetratricopeptide (TPR) repeat protein
MDPTPLLDLLGRVRDGDHQAAAELLRDYESHIHLILERRLANSAAAQLFVGGVYEVVADLAKAEAAYRQALILQPGAPLAIARLAALLRGNLASADRAALAASLADPHLDRNQRAQLLFAQAQVLDATGDYARAANCLRDANALRLESNQGDGEYSAGEHERFVDRLIRVFDRGFFGKLSGEPVADHRPVFVFGLPRSGTTLIEQILASHSRIHGAGELFLAQRSFEAIPEKLGRPGAPIDCVSQLDSSVLASLASHYMAELDRLNPDQRDRIVDKMPDNYLYLGLLSAMFPRGIFIHCRRDLRDTAVSCWMTDFSSIRWANSAQQIAARLRDHRRLMDHWRKVIPTPIHEVDYEQVVRDTERVARRLVSACAVDWEPGCLEFHRNRRPVQSASVTQVREPIHRRSVARWKNYEEPLAELFAAISVGDWETE